MKKEPLKNEIHISNYNTYKEIKAQPRLWGETYAIIEKEKAKLISFLKKALSFKDLHIILTGAGTSAFIGDILVKRFQRKTGKMTIAVATTDLISHSKDYLNQNHPILLVSFARSGDSPESLETINLASISCKKLFHLIITCNPTGQLVKKVNKKNSYVLLMPEEANDKALAMTSSFTTMLLAGVLVSDFNRITENKAYVNQLSAYGEKIFENYNQRICEVAKLNFNRVVFLGSGPLKGIARESQLKVQELTDGQVICKYDSFLGLRHGPKAVIDYSTLVVYLFSTDDFVNKYEYDLVRSINAQKEKLYEIGIGEVIKNKNEITLDFSIEVSETNTIPEEYFAICAVIPGQLLGLYKSIDLGLSPDSPSVNNSINRVVQGVNIYKQK